MGRSRHAGHHCRHAPIRNCFRSRDLDRGFIRPEYPAQVIVSYFQAGRICDYIQSRWGDDKLLDMVHSFAQKTTTAAVIQKDLGMAPEEFDKQFMAWLYESTGSDGGTLR